MIQKTRLSQKVDELYTEESTVMQRFSNDYRSRECSVEVYALDGSAPVKSASALYESASAVAERIDARLYHGL